MLSFYEVGAVSDGGHGAPVGPHFVYPAVTHEGGVAGAAALVSRVTFPAVSSDGVDGGGVYHYLPNTILCCT